MAAVILHIGLKNWRISNRANINLIIITAFSTWYCELGKRLSLMAWRVQADWLLFLITLTMQPGKISDKQIEGWMVMLHGMVLCKLNWTYKFQGTQHSGSVPNCLCEIGLDTDFHLRFPSWFVVWWRQMQYPLVKPFSPRPMLQSA